MPNPAENDGQKNPIDIVVPAIIDRTYTRLDPRLRNILGLAMRIALRDIDSEHEGHWNNVSMRNLHTDFHDGEQFDPVYSAFEKQGVSRKATSKAIGHVAKSSMGMLKLGMTDYRAYLKWQTEQNKQKKHSQ